MLHVHALGHAHPGNEITNRFLEELDIGTTNEWIVERVGIRARRTVLPLDYIRETCNRDLREAAGVAEVSNAELGARAARMAIERAGIEPGAIGMLICGSSAPASLSPAEACTVAEQLGLEIPAFDVNSACTSFLAGIHLVANLRPEALPDFVLTVVVDTLTQRVDYRDRASAVLFGDAAAASVVSCRHPGRARIEATDLQSSPEGASKVRIPTFDYFDQNGRAVQMFAIRRTVEGLRALQEHAADDERRFHFAGHQANLRVLEQACERCGIDPDLHHSNVELFGNTGAPSSPSVVSERWEKWSPSDDVGVVAVGSGLSWGRALLRFGAAG